MFSPIEQTVPTTNSNSGSSGLETDLLRGASTNKSNFQSVSDRNNNESNTTIRKSRESEDSMRYMCMRALHALIAGINYGVALMLMLVAMTFNPSLLVALIFGYMIGDFIFFVRMRPNAVETCHLLFCYCINCTFENINCIRSASLYFNELVVKYYELRALLNCCST